MPQDARKACYTSYPTCYIGCAWPARACAGAQTHEEWMTFRNQTYYAGVTERLNAMNDAELEAAYEQAVRELRERQEEVMQERRAGYWMDAPQMSREHQMVCAEYHNRLYGDDQRDEDASGYSATVADGLERWTR